MRELEPEELAALRLAAEGKLRTPKSKEVRRRNLADGRVAHSAAQAEPPNPNKPFEARKPFELSEGQSDLGRSDARPAAPARPGEFRPRPSSASLEKTSPSAPRAPPAEGFRPPPAGEDSVRSDRGEPGRISAQGNSGLPDRVRHVHSRRSQRGRKTTALHGPRHVLLLTQPAKAVPRSQALQIGRQPAALGEGPRQAAPSTGSRQAGRLQANPLQIDRHSTNRRSASRPGRSPTAAIARPSSGPQHHAARHLFIEKNSSQSSRAACASTPLNRATPTATPAHRNGRPVCATYRQAQASASPAVSRSRVSRSPVSTSQDSKDRARQSLVLKSRISKEPER